jgi:hypothetical protein
MKNKELTKLDYRTGGNKVRMAYFLWREACPWEDHRVVSFVAGYNAGFKSALAKNAKKKS